MVRVGGRSGRFGREPRTEGRDGDFGNTGLVRMTRERCQALGSRQGVKGTRRVPAIAIFEMVQDLADDAGFGDERNDAHFAAAVFANQRVGFEHTADQVGPSSAKGFALSDVELVVVVCGSFLSGMFSTSSGVVTVVQDRMLVGLGNVNEHANEEVERVEELGFSVF